MLNALIDSIKELLHQNKSRAVFIVIDGRAGAGKTTLANEIVNRCGVGEIIHCDDLYNGWNDALTPTFERHVREWVTQPLMNGEMPTYQKYDWEREEFQSAIKVPSTSLIILEGVGAALPFVTDLADLAIWIDIPEEVGLNRVLQRDGEVIHREMLQWMAQQRDFFAEHHNRTNCSIHIDYGAPAQP